MPKPPDGETLDISSNTFEAEYICDSASLGDYGSPVHIKVNRLRGDLFLYVSLCPFDEPGNVVLISTQPHSNAFTIRLYSVGDIYNNFQASLQGRLTLSSSVVLSD